MKTRKRPPETYERILTFIHEYKLMHGKPPFQHEIGEACGLSGRTTQLCLEKLEREGKLKHYGSMRRGFDLVEGARTGD